MEKHNRQFKTAAMLFVDAMLVLTALYLGVYLRFALSVPYFWMTQLENLIVPAIIINLASYYIFGFYRRVRRYASIDELILIAAAVSIGLGGTYLYSLLAGMLPRSSYIITWFLLMLLIGGSRLSVRLLYDILSKQQKALINSNFNRIIGMINSDLFKRIVHLLLLVLVFLSVYNGKHNIASISLDPSWQNAYNYFAVNDFQLGSDIVFTYGPLGFLGSNIFHPELYWYKLAYSFFIAIYTCVVFYYVIGKKNFFIAILSLFSLIVFTSTEILIYSLMLNSCMLLIIPLKRNYNNWISIILISFFLSLVSLIKFTFFSAGIIVVFLSTVSYILIKKNNYALFLPMTYILFLIVMWTASGQSIPGIIEYLHASYYISSGYNEAMALKGPNSEIFAGLFFWVLIVCSLPIHETFKMIYKRISQSTELLIGILITLFFCFMIWKIGYTRHDGHVTTFFVFLTYIPSTFILLHNSLIRRELILSNKVELNSSFSFLRFLERKEIIKKARLISITLLFMSVICFMNFTYHSVKAKPAILYSMNNIMEQTRLLSVNNLNHQYNKLNEDLKNYKRENEMPLTNALIDNSTVDIYNYNQNLLIYNELNWLPRPVFQSYSAYNTVLLERNYNYLLDNNAPEYILFKTQSIDGRYPLLDDNLWVREVISSYKPLIIENDHLLLKKKSNMSNLSEDLLLKEIRSVGFNEYINTNSEDELSYVSINLSYNAIGKIRSLLFQPPFAFIEAKLSDKTTRRYRIIPNMVEQPFLLSPIIDSNYKLILSMADLAYLDVIKYRVVTSSLDQLFFKPEINIQIYEGYEVNEVIQNSYKKLVEEYYNTNIYRDLKLLEVDNKTTTSDTGTYYINKVNGMEFDGSVKTINNSIVKLDGWAINEGSNNVPKQVFARLSDEKGNAFYAMLLRTERHDVAKHFNNEAYVNSGFTGILNFEGMEEGIYKIDIIQYNHEHLVYPQEAINRDFYLLYLGE